MRILIIGLSAVALLMTGAYYAFAQENRVCVEFNGLEYCEVETILKLGETEVPIDDPFALLSSAKKSKVEEIGLWEVYKYPDVIVELSRQLSITEDELIFALRDSNSAWSALYELTQIYGSVSRDLLSQTTPNTVDMLFRKILKEITEDIIKQLEEYNGDLI